MGWILWQSLELQSPGADGTQTPPFFSAPGCLPGKQESAVTSSKRCACLCASVGTGARGAVGVAPSWVHQVTGKHVAQVLEGSVRPHGTWSQVDGECLPKALC